MEKLMDPLDPRPAPPSGWKLTEMPNGSLVIEAPNSIGCLVTGHEAHPCAAMLYRLAAALQPNREPT